MRTANGNITQIRDGSNTVQYRYAYDALGQLIREDNRALNQTLVYTYDGAGNIESKTVYAFTTSSTLGAVQQTFSYTYGDTSWGDLLTNWNGTAITYDAIGNPTQIGTSMLTWQGRQLMSYVGNGKTLSFTYNADGIRTTKTVDGVAHEYILSGSQVIAEKWGNHTVAYFYDENGTPIGLCYRNNADAWGVASYYFFDKNLQGDIVAIYNESGVKIGSYTYDAWGNFTVTQTAGISELDALVLNTYNPFRYRGYFYDVETGLYYVSSRYYDPEIGRWINVDGEISEIGGDVLGYNLFAYCFNNPVNMHDPTGEWPKWLSGALNIAGGTLQVLAGTALGATIGWTGFGAVAAGFLVVNGAATAVQGVGQIVNHITNSNVMREDNIIRSGFQEVGRAIGGDTGAKIAGGAYDVAVLAANLYAGKVGLQQAGKLPIKVNINNLVNNPLDEFVTSGPANGVIQQYCRTIPQSGYGKIYATQLGNGLYQIANGHHRVAALRTLGYKTIKIFLTK